MEIKYWFYIGNILIYIGIIYTGCDKNKINVVEKIFLPKIPLYPNDLTVKFRRVQFPIKACFAMTINKAQGQSVRFYLIVV